MDSSKCSTTIEIDALVKIVRLELKEWEQSFAAAHQGRKAGREDIKQHPEIGRKSLPWDILQSFTDAIKHANTNSTTDYEDPLPSNLSLTAPLPRKGALLPIYTRFPLHASARSTLNSSTLPWSTPAFHSLLSTCLLGPSVHLSGPHPRRMAKSSDSSINSLNPHTRRHLRKEKDFPLQETKR